MDQSANIAKSLKSLWTAYGPLADDVPGGIIYGLRKAGSLYPYASLTIRLGETQYTSGDIYAQDYHVAILVWATQSVAMAGQIQTDLNQCFNKSIVLSSLSDNARLIQNTIDTGDVGEDPERSLADLILIAQTRFILTLQESRP